MDSASSTDGNAKVSAFEVLQRRVAEVHWRWKVWKQLFKPRTAELAREHDRLMRSQAPAFFGMLQDVLLADVILRLCKLSDSVDSHSSITGARRKNLSLKASMQDAKQRLDAASIAETDRFLKMFEQAVVSLRVWRNWRLAHDDHEVAIGNESLPVVKFDDIERAMTTAVSIVQLVDPDFASREYMYEGMIANGDGESLLNVMRCSERYHSECIAQGRRPLAYASGPSPSPHPGR